MAEEKKVKLEEEDVTSFQDAPGYGNDGPICYKCSGSGKKKWHKGTFKTCPVCFGSGRIPKKKLKPRNKTKTNRKFPKDYIIPGPLFPQIDEDVKIDEESEEICFLLGHWKIIQSLPGGHRWSTDDLLTAWVACTEQKRLFPTNQLQKHLDLGCGIGSVLLMTCWFFHDVAPRGVGIEAQSVSADKARRNVILNGVNDRLTVFHQDFREAEDKILQIHGNFNLVTGTPPYFPVEFDDKGVVRSKYGGLPTFQQSAPARFEFRGGIEDYLMTARKYVEKPNGLIVICEGNLSRTPHELLRVEKAAEVNSLKLIKSVLVLGREDKPPLFAVHALLPKETTRNDLEFVREEFVVRHVGGKRTKQYLDMCYMMGIAYCDDDEDKAAVEEEEEEKPQFDQLSN